MRPFTILLLALASSAVRAQSPVVVAGQVTDAATGLPIEDATVSIANQLRYADSGGGYTLDPVTPGKAAVGVEAKGYLGFQGEIEIAADQTTHNFFFSPRRSPAGSARRIRNGGVRDSL